jgi:[ribosomal protein S18]-alanine N-acetyltransferase
MSQQMRTSQPASSSRRVPPGSPFGVPLRSPSQPARARIRRGAPADLDALCEFENRVWSDRISRHSLRRLLVSQSAEILVAHADGAITGVAIVLFRMNSRIARLYSIAVAPEHTGRGIASALLAQAETVARSRRCLSLRLEVHESNRGAIKVYAKARYRQFGRHARYYEDSGDALRFEKKLAPAS